MMDVIFILMVLRNNPGKGGYENCYDIRKSSEEYSKGFKHTT